ncbi:virB8 family protein [Halomonas sp. 3A7M]|uniref:virB8 family protein n=1 Tax=Halomonas sp. 3A7M TaxID=2742616 RepID=UPI0018680B38|nr:type IV secretion system protein [Halomonas sp. 3A7M]
MLGTNKEVGKSKPPKEKQEKIKKDDWKQYLSERNTLEAEIIGEAYKSRSRAWSVAKVSSAITIGCLLVMAILIYRYSQPLPPNLLTINDDTGEVSTVTLMREEISYGTALDRYWLSRYVVARETYNFFNQQEHYDTVMLMSSRQVGAEYADQFGGDSGLDVRWGDSRTIRVNVTSVIPNESNPGTATVRFNTQVRDLSRSRPDPVEYWIAQINYHYPNSTMTSTQREVNPLGFRVRGYEVQPEMLGPR